jgi:indole-3-glycerol phosphate synthase
MYKGVEIIAEVKTRSPFGYVAEKSWDELFAIAENIGDIISIHTDERWGGSFDLLKEARARTEKSILAKGIHANNDDIALAFDHGADWVLVVGRMSPIQPEKCLIEPLTLQELAAIPLGLRAVWNSRDLSDGSLKKETFAEARTAFSGWLCQASNIRTVADIAPGADAVLVGTHLGSFASSLV